MRNLLQYVMAVMMIVSAGACSKDDDEQGDGLIWDIAPSEVRIQLVDKDGQNLLDPAVDGNWVGEPMWISYDDKSYDAIWNGEELQPLTRAIHSVFYGTVWTGVWTDRNYALSFGQFSGEGTQNLNLTFGITAINTVYEFDFSHRLVWNNKEPHFDDHITYRGQRIDGNVLKLTVPENPYSDKAN